MAKQKKQKNVLSEHVRVYLFSSCAPVAAWIWKCSVFFYLCVAMVLSKLPSSSPEKKCPSSRQKNTLLHPFRLLLSIPRLWWLLIVYMFYCQATICDEYFVEAIKVVVERFKIPEDVGHR